MTRTECLKRAQDIVMGQREDEYGTPEDSFSAIAALWTAYIGYKAVKFTAADVACMMILLKIARLKGSASHADSWVDAAGYAACGAEAGTGKCTDE